MYDPRIARFTSNDALTKKFPMLTPYQFASNSPVWLIDLDGLEGVSANNINVQKTGNLAYTLTADVNIKYKVLNLSSKENYEIDYSRYNSHEVAGFIESNLETVSTAKHSYIASPTVALAPTVTYKLNVTVTFQEVNSIDQINDNDFAIVVVDKLEDGFMDKFGNKHSTGAHVVNGTVAFVPAEYMTSIAKPGSSRLVRHELFHTLGLEDIEDKALVNNLMYHLNGKGGESLTKEQLGESSRHLFNGKAINKLGKSYTTPNRGTKGTIGSELKRTIYKYNKTKSQNAKISN